MTPFQYGQYNPPELSDEAAAEIMAFFSEFMIILEKHYEPQLRRHHKMAMPEQLRLFDEIDDPQLPF